MAVYIFLIITTLVAALFNSYLSKSQFNKVLFVAICLILVIVSSIRSYTVGADTEQYVRAFYGGASFFREFEIGFACFLDGLRLISDSYLILMLASSIIILLPIFYLIYWKSTNPFFSLYILICLHYYSMYLTAMRQSIAVAILIIGYILYEKCGKKKYFLISVLVGTCFHYTSIVAISYLLIEKLEFSFKKFAIVFIISCASLPFVYTIFYNIALSFQIIHYDEYVTSVNFSNNNYYGMLIKVALNLAFLIYIYIGRYNSKFSVEDRISWNRYMMFAAVSTILMLIATQAVVLERLVMYFDYVYLVSLTCTAQFYKSKYRPIIYMLLTFVLMLHWGIISIYRPEWHGVIPYQVNSIIWN